MNKVWRGLEGISGPLFVEKGGYIYVDKLLIGVTYCKKSVNLLIFNKKYVKNRVNTLIKLST